jgi:hypothetical protein
VVKGAAVIGQNAGLNQSELDIVHLSALFHDVGYISSDENHEAESWRIAEEFLSVHLVKAEETDLVKRAIMATRIPQEPDHIISEVLCDADLMHLASGAYFELMELLRLEWQKTGRQNLTESEFHQYSIGFFDRHHFHTEFGKTVMKAKKDLCLRKIHERVDFLRSV